MRGFSTKSNLRKFRLIAVYLSCAWAILTASSYAPAQETANSPKTTEAKPEEPKAKKEIPSTSARNSADGLLPPATYKYLLNENNEPVPVPNGPTLEGYNKWLEEERNKPQGPQPYTVSEVDIVGTANDERANLFVTFTVMLNSPDKWERVPLYFNDSVLLAQAVYSGDGKEVLDRKDPKLGYVWWFKGKGPHRLKLNLSVSLQKPIPSRHLIVTLPTSAVSHIQLTLPYASVTAKALPEQSVVFVKPGDESKSTIEAIGLGSHLDLTWQPNVDVRPTDTSLEVTSTMFAEIEADTMFLRVNQRISSFQGPFEQVSVRLPTNSELIKLESPEKITQLVDPDNRQRVIVNFKEKFSLAQLNWSLRLPAKMRTRMVLEGFVVEGARRHTGKIGLAVGEGLQLIDRRDHALQSIPIGDFPSTMGTPVRAYQFGSQSFSLAFSFDEVKPHFEVKPQLTLSASTQQVTLDAEFQYRIDRNGLDEVTLAWPNYKAEGWSIDSIDEPGIVESYQIDERGQILVRLVGHQTRSFGFHLRATRPIKPGDEVAFSTPRPRLASRVLPTSLVIVNAENVETDLAGRGETVFYPLPNSSVEALALPESTKDLKITAFRVDTDEQAFVLRVTPQKQKIRTESYVDAHWKDNQFYVTQQLEYDVSYERLNQVRLTVPSTIDFDRIRFFKSGDIELKPELLPSAPGADRQIQLKLGESLLGHFEIEARFSVLFSRLPSFDREARIAIPILDSLDEPASQTKVTLAQSGWFEAEPIAADVWRPQRSQRDSWEWISDGAQADISLKLVHSVRANESGSISRALISVALEGTGEGVVRAQFRVSTRSPMLPVQLPASSKSVAFFLGTKPLTDREFAESPVGSRRYEVQLPERLEGSTPTERLLTVTYSEDFGSQMGWSDKLELIAPTVLNCSWGRVYWQIVLPAGQHLLNYPVSATPMFHWRRVGAVWKRISDYDANWLKSWIDNGSSVELETDEVFSGKVGNTYLFRQLDSPKPLVFQTLSSPMVLLFGAGFSLIVGFIMLRLVVFRHVLTLLTLGLIIATVGLWHSAALELLLQPMIAGMIFPLMAVALDGWVRERYHAGIPSFEGHGELPSSRSINSPFVVRQADPNESTLHRPGQRSSDSRVEVESGSGVS